MAPNGPRARTHRHTQWTFESKFLGTSYCVKAAPSTGSPLQDPASGLLLLESSAIVDKGVRNRRRRLAGTPRALGSAERANQANQANQANKTEAGAEARSHNCSWRRPRRASSPARASAESGQEAGPMEKPGRAGSRAEFWCAVCKCLMTLFTA